MIDIYTTTNLNEAVILKYYEHKLQCVDKTQRRAEFCFEQQIDTNKLLISYRERQLQVEPFAFYQCQRDIKDRLYNG